MARVSLHLESPVDLATLSTTGWRFALGLVPGERNQGLVGELRSFVRWYCRVRGLKDGCERSGTLFFLVGADLSSWRLARIL